MKMFYFYVGYASTGSGFGVNNLCCTVRSKDNYSQVIDYSLHNSAILSIIQLLLESALHGRG